MTFSIDAWGQQYENPEVNSDESYLDAGSDLYPLGRVVPLVSEWWTETDQPLFTQHSRNDTYLEDYQLSPFIMAVQSQNGNFAYIGKIRPGFSGISVAEAEFVYIGTVDFTGEPISVDDFQWEYEGTVAAGIAAPNAGIVGFITGVPGSSEAIVTIDGLNVSTDVQGTVTVTREDNTAARFKLAINSDTLKAVEFVNKEVIISFQVADNNGVTADYIPIFKGVCKRVGLNYLTGEYIVQGFDYGGIHQTKGELVSQNVTEVLTGSVYISGAGSFNTGKNPIWGVTYSGNADVVDGRDYFVDTLNGIIIVPVSSTLIQFPSGLSYQYMVPFGTLKLLMQEVLDTKGWIMQEDGVALVDYTDPARQPVLSVSNESVIDITRRFLELSGAKLDSNLFPNLRVYSELTNFTGEDEHIIDESVIIGGSLLFDIDMDGLITEQTVRSVQKTNAEITVSAVQQLALQEGSQEPQVLLNQVVAPASTIPIDFSVRKAIVAVRVSRGGVFSISSLASGTLSVSSLSRAIVASDWEMTLEDTSFVFTLYSTPFWILTNLGAEGWFWFVAYPGADWSLIISGQKISYGDSTIDNVVEVTASRPVTGVATVLKGDTYENPYIETSAHAANLTNAILLEHGNVYFANAQVPIYAGASMNIGDKIGIYDNSNELFSGLIKVLRYELNMDTGKNTLHMGMQGVGFTI